MRSDTIFLLVWIFAAAASAQTQQVGPLEKEVIAVVLGKEITGKDKHRLSGLVLGELLEQFARDNRIEPTEEELDAFITNTENSRRQQRAALEKSKRQLAEELESVHLSENERKQKQSQLRTIDAILKTERQRQSPSDASDGQTRVMRQTARQFVRSWKINKELYARYGGRVIFQQAGVEPIDAYREFLREQEKKGAFRIVDPNCQPSFWRYFTNDAMHVFYPEAEGARFINTPWWMTERVPAQ